MIVAWLAPLYPYPCYMVREHRHRIGPAAPYRGHNLCAVRSDFQNIAGHHVRGSNYGWIGD